MRKLFITGILLIVSEWIHATSIAQTRSLTLRDGMNYSWLEQYWVGDPAIHYSDYLDLSHLPRVKTELQTMHAMGFETLRLPVTFDKWEDGVAPYTFDSVNYFIAIDSIVSWCSLYNMNLIIVYHHGKLFDSNFSTELPRVIQLWKQVADRYSTTNPDKVFFELYNEPFDISSAHWRTAAIAMIDSLRPLLPNHTFIVGANEWNSLYKLNEMGVLPDPNIIYNFHFYEPYIFTHQGATWGGAGLSTTGIPFPYNSATMPPMNPLVINTQGEGAYNNYYQAGTFPAVESALNIAASFGVNNNVPLWCGEFGSYKAFTPNESSRCLYTECVKNNLDQLQIPYAYWEWDEGFSIFDGSPSFANLPQCMVDIFDILQTSASTISSLLKGYNRLDKNVLQWTSLNSTYTSFSIERSEDATTYNSIGYLEFGSTGSPSAFNFTDENAPQGTSFYRIRQSDRNGNNSFTNVLSLRNRSGLLTATIFPNPSNEIITVSCGEKFNGLVIQTLLGKDVLRIENNNRADVSQIPSGIYLVKLTDRMNDVIATGKFVKN